MTNSISSMLWISIVIPDFKRHNKDIMAARVYFMKMMNGCKDGSQCLRKLNNEDGQGYPVCILQFSCFTKYNRMQSKHKQTNCKHRDVNLSDFSFLSRYHYNKSKNYLKRRYQIRHWIPMFILDICTVAVLQIKLWNRKTTFISSHVYVFSNQLIKWDWFDSPNSGCVSCLFDYFKA